VLNFNGKIIPFTSSVFLHPILVLSDFCSISSAPGWTGSAFTVFLSLRRSWSLALVQFGPIVSSNCLLSASLRALDFARSVFGFFCDHESAPASASLGSWIWFPHWPSRPGAAHSFRSSFACAGIAVSDRYCPRPVCPGSRSGAGQAKPAARPYFLCS
jgi:hypothetical protein